MCLIIFSNFVRYILLGGLTEIMENDEFSILCMRKEITFWLIYLLANIGIFSKDMQYATLLPRIFKNKLSHPFVWPSFLGQ